METADHIQEKSRQPKLRWRHLSSLYDKKWGWWLGNSLHASLAEMLSFCLKAWALERCLPSLGWVKTISFSMIAAELKWRIIYLNFWSMKQNAASVYCVCLRDHKSGEKFTKRLVSGLIPTFSCKRHRMRGGSTSLWTAPPPPPSKKQYFLLLTSYHCPTLLPLLSSRKYVLNYSTTDGWWKALVLFTSSHCYYQEQWVWKPLLSSVQSYWQPHTTPWVFLILSPQHLIAPVSLTLALNPGAATCNQTSCMRASRQGLSKASGAEVQVAKTDVEV